MAHQCNSCPIKNRCTDSDEGRVIEVQRDSWVESELRNFHRGLSLTLSLLADLILVVTILRQNDTQSSRGRPAFTLHYGCGPSVSPSILSTGREENLDEWPNVVTLRRSQLHSPIPELWRIAIELLHLKTHEKVSKHEGKPVESLLV